LLVLINVATRCVIVRSLGLSLQSLCLRTVIGAADRKNIFYQRRRF
jgi:hypothetical protein